MEAESEEERSSLKADIVPNETKVKLEESSETLEDSNEVDKATRLGGFQSAGSKFLFEVKDGDKYEDEKDLASPKEKLIEKVSTITLFHCDLPQGLENEHGGFLSHKIVKDFAFYAEVCFREYGDRMKHWITLNESLLYSILGYGSGGSPPTRCSKWMSSS
ncbi:hypothetical protein PIB30_043854 [Stylosanthes scabra]|uniref:Thioglucosidase n=1 Tax=Stylosanthes scabra TaxID=79078 RepID=A0ABU6YD38_9FABA|nr:hypothetical protein [Stylosanthes scabra]